ncbi:MAG TPA: extracellular solute-binding protein [Candidatus Limnocylindrales bacterium]|nr:extracellular solute-binding protein [Candidatus Limnocylindrales bacterium]
MSRKLLVVVQFAVVTVLLVVLSAQIVSAQDGVTVSITGVSGAELEWVNTVIKPGFEAEMAAAGTPITVEVIDSSNLSGEDLKQQYVLDISVGEGADLMGFDGFWLPEFVDGGLLQPLSTLVGPSYADWEGWAEIPEGVQDIMRYQGELYGMPRGTDARVVWVNTEILAQAGLPADWQPTSWAELLDGARAIRDNVPGVVPIQLNAGTAMGEATTLQGYLLALLGTGDYIYDYDAQKWVVRSQGILDTLGLYDTIYNQEGLGETRWQLVQNGRDLSFEAFSQGTVGMLLEGDYFWRSILNETGDFPMENRDARVSFVKVPAQEPGMGWRGQDFVTASGGTGFAINPNVAHPAEAWALLTYMYSKPQLEQLQAIQPRIRARLDVPVTNDAVMSRIVTDVLPLTQIRPQLPDYNAVSEQARLMTERVISGEMTPTEAMDAYAVAVTEIVGADNVIDRLGS